VNPRPVIIIVGMPISEAPAAICRSVSEKNGGASAIIALMRGAASSIGRRSALTFGSAHGLMSTMTGLGRFKLACRQRHVAVDSHASEEQGRERAQRVAAHADLLGIDRVEQRRAAMGVFLERGSECELGLTPAIGEPELRRSEPFAEFELHRGTGVPVLRLVADERGLTCVRTQDCLGGIDPADADNDVSMAYQVLLVEVIAVSGAPSPGEKRISG
jgi:hypothetical protein